MVPDSPAVAVATASAAVVAAIAITVTEAVVVDAVVVDAVVVDAVVTPSVFVIGQVSAVLFVGSHVTLPKPLSIHKRSVQQ